MISAVYMLRAYRNIFQGDTVKVTEDAPDLTSGERLPALVLAVALLVVGLYPNSLLRFLGNDTPPAPEAARVESASQPPAP